VRLPAVRLAVWLLLAPLMAAAPPRRVLLLGNSAYQHLPALRTPKANVDALKDALSKMQFAPQVAYDLGQAGMIDLVDRFIGTVQPGDFVLIYFSGYGYQDSASGLNYLLPVDFDARDGKVLNSKALSLRRIESLLEGRKAGTKMLLLDASRQAPGLPVGLSTVAPRTNSVVSFSAAENQVAPDPANGGVNLYTAALIHAMTAPGSTPANVATRASTEVNAGSEAKQSPFVLMRAPDEDTFFTPMPAAVPPSLVASGAASTKGKAAARRPGEPKINPQDGLTYVWIPPGTFQMGCSAGDDGCLDDEKPAHEVTISKGFWLGQTEVTQEAFQKVVSKNPSRLKGAKLPVNFVAWGEARSYCVSVGMRLPTEAEWEYAARAGSPGSRYGEPDQIAWFARNAGNQTHDVAGKKANAWGLYDMLGNVWEWVFDWFAPYAEGAVTDPRGPATGQFHVRRGGALGSLAGLVRVSVRGGNVGAIIGIRCAGS
jgi:formylglycine-generating enzyme required for sulfatase activity